MMPWIMLASESPVGQADEGVAIAVVLLAAERELALALEFVLFVEAVTVKLVGLGGPASAVKLYNGEVAPHISSLLLAAFCLCCNGGELNGVGTNVCRIQLKRVTIRSSLGRNQEHVP
jgi:hypothetical protein